MQGRIVVKEVKPPEKVIKPGDLILPETAKEKTLMKGIVVGCGTPTPDYDCSQLGLGTKVVFVEYSSAETIEEGEKYRVLRYEDVIYTVS